MLISGHRLWLFFSYFDGKTGLELRYQDFKVTIKYIKPSDVLLSVCPVLYLCPPGCHDVMSW